MSNTDKRCNYNVFWRYRNSNDPKLTNFTCVMIKLHCQKWPSHSFLLMTKEEKYLEEQPLLQLSLCQNCPKLFLITSKSDDEGGKASPWTEKLVPQALLLQLSSSKRLLKLPQTCQTCQKTFQNTCQTCQKTKDKKLSQTCFKVHITS